MSGAPGRPVGRAFVRLVAAVLLGVWAGAAAADCGPDGHAVAERTVEGAHRQSGRGGDLRTGFGVRMPAAAPAAAPDRSCRIRIDLGYRWRSGEIGVSGRQAAPAPGTPAPEAPVHHAVRASLDPVRTGAAAWSIGAGYEGSIGGDGGAARSVRTVSRLTLFGGRVEAVSSLRRRGAGGAWVHEHRVAVAALNTDALSVRARFEGGRGTARRVGVAAGFGDGGLGLGDLLASVPAAAGVADGVPWRLLPSLSEVSGGAVFGRGRDRRDLGFTLTWPDKRIDSAVAMRWQADRLHEVRVGLTGGSRIGNWLRVSVRATRTGGALGRDAGLLIETGWTH